MTFKDHFSGHAARYRESRPRYPDALSTWLSCQCRGHDLAWDAGCGNGQAAVALAGHFHAVFASDPSHEQIAHAIAHPGIQYRVEPAEQCGLSDHAADLATIAQAMHWVELDGYYAEVRRGLKPAADVAARGYGLMHITPAVSAGVQDSYEPMLGPRLAPERRP